MGLLLRRSSSSQEPSLARESGVSMGEVITPLHSPSPGNTCAPRCHPAVGLLPPGHMFPGAGGAPGRCPSAPPGAHPAAGSIPPPWVALGCPRCVGPTGQAAWGWGVKSWFLAAGGHQQLLCIMESYLCSPKPSCQAVAFFFSFLSRSRHPAFVLRKEKPRRHLRVGDAAGAVPQEAWGDGAAPSLSPVGLLRTANLALDFFLNFFFSSFHLWRC